MLSKGQCDKPHLAEEKNWTGPQWSSLLFRWKEILHLIWKSNFRVWMKSRESQNPSVWSPVGSFHSLWWFWVPCDLLMCLKWIHSQLPGHLLHGFTCFMKMLISFLQQDAASNIHELNPTEKLRHVIKRKMRNTRLRITVERKASVRTPSASCWSSSCYGTLMK